jgi:GAF domain-containing protein
VSASQDRVFREQYRQLAALAGGWLASGARSFVVRPTEGEVLVWPAGAPPESPSSCAPIAVNGSQIASLEVSGVERSWVEGRLATDASLLAALLQLEDELQQMTSHLVETQDQLLSLYNLAELGQRRLGLNDVLRQVAERAAPLFPVEGTFAMVQSPGWPLLIEHHPAIIAGRERMEWVLEQLNDGINEIWWRDESGEGGIRNLLVTSVKLQGASWLAVGLVNKADIAYTVPEVRLVQAIAEHGGTQVENILLYEQTLQQARLQAEMELARSVQLNLAAGTCA